MSLPRTLWLTIRSAPVLHLIATPDALAHLPATDRRVQILADVGRVQAGVEDENPTLVCDVRNESGQARAVLEDPPLGCAAELTSPDGVVFAGVVQEVALAAPSGRIRIGA